MDILSPHERSRRMALIKAKNTKVELILRHVTYGMGYRYRLHISSLPGKPDLVFPKLQKIIFMHGCFWHGHSNCRKARLPKSRRDYWIPKISGNRMRDLRVMKELLNQKWRVLVVWECQLQKLDKLKIRIRRFLDATQSTKKALF